jgi:hypothetical protein
VSPQLLSAADLPAEFSYPRLFVRVVELGLVDLEPWSVLQDAELRRRTKGVKERYPQRRLVPFARRVDRDDVACFDVDAGSGRISVIEDFGEPGFEQFETYDHFADRFRAAIDDLIEFDE